MRGGESAQEGNYGKGCGWINLAGSGVRMVGGNNILASKFVKVAKPREATVKRGDMMGCNYEDFGLGVVDRGMGVTGWKGAATWLLTFLLEFPLNLHTN